MRTRTSVYQRMRSARVITHHATDATPVRCRCLRTEKQPVRLACYVQLIPHHTGFHPCIPFLRIDLQDTIHIPTHVCHDAFAYHLTGNRRTSCARNNTRSSTTRLSDQSRQICLIFRICHAIRYLAIHTRIRRVRHLMQTVRQYLHQKS